MKRLLITAMESGSGKTVLTCALLRALQRRGLSPESFKCGPDYIDPMFHRRVLGVSSRNLDRFLQGREGVRRALAGQRGEIALIEGAMGYYDGVNGTAEASAWQLAAEEDIPALLVLRPRGSSLTLAAQVRGLMSFRAPSRIAGLFLTDCRQGLHDHLKPVLERETGLPVTGYLPPMEEARLESRHLGLVTADEVADFSRRFDRLAEKLEETADLDRLLDLAGEAAGNGVRPAAAATRCRIAVARDEAFCFYYEDSLESLKAAGAELVFFSPIRDRGVPPAEGLYLGGGYPELYAETLSGNRPMRQSVREAVEAGLPTTAECGGFLYLQQALRDAEGRSWPMAEALPGEGFPTGGLTRFGYAWLTAEKDSLLFRAGEKVPVHEFHHWDSTDNGTDLRAVKPSGRSWDCGRASPSLYAAFPHLHLGGEIPLAARFVEAAVRYGKERGT